MYIGDIYLPILSNIDKKSVSKITKEIAGINITDPKTVSIRRNLQPITLEGYLYNDGEKNDAQYAEDVEALQYRSAGYCYTQYADLDGFIEIENAEAPQTSEELGVRNYSIEGKYLPATKYERVVEVETEMRENEFNIEFPPHVALPMGATNVRVKTSQDSVKLSAPAFMAGDIPIYRPFPAFYPADVTHSDSDAPQYDATAYKLTYNLLDAKDESISYTMVSGIDIPLGTYRVVLRIKADSTVNGDVKITVSDGTTNVVDSLHTLVGDGVWNIVKTASFSILQRGLTYTVTVSKATDDVSNIAVNYGFLLPEKRARVAFDVAAEYDVGECKVYDTITTDAAEAGWIQVYNPEHDFAGDIVVQNSMFRWVIKQTAWKDATKVYNVSGATPVEIGELYNKAFGDDSVAIKFKEIKPNYLKFTFELDTGNATSESTSAKEIDTVEITPFNVVIDKDVIGTYKDHYTFESTPGAMVEYENGVIVGIDSNSVYGLIKSVDVTSSIDGDIIETTGSESSDSYVVPFVIPCEITTYLYKQAADLVISKDNNDIERKFWKDDFSVDSKENWDTDVGTVTVDTVNKKLVHSGSAPGSNWSLLAPSNAPVSPRKLSFICNIDPEGANNTNWRYIRFYIGSSYIGEFRRQDNSTEYHFQLMSGTIDLIEGFNLTAIGTYESDTHVEFEIGSDNIVYGYLNGVLRLKGTIKSGVDISGAFNFGVRISGGSSVNFEFKEVTVSPSESYSDDFTTDTVTDGRYQALNGSVSYDGTNDLMVITSAGAGVPAPVRLKSYKFGSGSIKTTISMPTGDGYRSLVRLSADGLLTAESSVSIHVVQSGAAYEYRSYVGATQLGTPVSCTCTSVQYASILIERDVEHGVWYVYCWNADTETQPTTPTFKIFTYLYPEVYLGVVSTSLTCYVKDISIRAESIIGRTNVEVEEDFWFRDEFSVDSKGRLSGTTSVATVDTVNGELDIVANISYCYLPPKMSDLNMSFTISSDWATSANIYREVCFSNATKEYPSGYSGALKAYILRFFPQDGFVRAKLYRKNGASLLTTESDVVATDNAEVPFSISYDQSTHSFEITIGGVTKTTSDPNETFNEGYIGFGGLNGTAIYSIKNLQISGTRVYNKPIHRGAMLGLYSTS